MAGDKPVSWHRITILVSVIVAVVLVLILIVALMSGRG
jgi:Co/Zn/Cd efflux system component